MREVFLLMKYNLTTLEDIFQSGVKIKFFFSNRIKIQENSVQILKTNFKYLKSVSKYTWFGN